MTVKGDEFLLEEASEIIMQELTETMSYCDECEIQVNDFIKIANCILSREEYYDLLEKYKKFESHFSILEALLSQIDFPLTVLQAVTTKATMKELMKDFNQIIEILELANIRIDANELDFPMAKFIQRLLKIVDIEAINYEDLDQAMEANILVLKTITVFDEDHPAEYYPFNVLRLIPCKDKIEAYQYAIQHGISKDYVINRHGAQFT